jgi:hypothetical protein
MEPTDLLSVTLQAQQWNVLLGILHDAGPYKVVHPLIQAIFMQFNEAVAQQSNGKLVEEPRPN